MKKPLKIFLVAYFVAAVPMVATAQDFSPPSFHGDTCTQDCSGHKAGYDWAARKGITDEDQCGGGSNSFREGCRAWAREQDDDAN